MASHMHVRQDHEVLLRKTRGSWASVRGADGPTEAEVTVRGLNAGLRFEKRWSEARQGLTTQDAESEGSEPVR